MGSRTRRQEKRLAEKRARKATRMAKSAAEGKSRYAEKLRLKKAGQRIGMWWIEKGGSGGNQASEPEQAEGQGRREEPEAQAAP